MTYQDTWAICTQCGRQFVFRVEQQRRQAERGEEIRPPELCSSCEDSARAGRPARPRREPPSRSSATELGSGPYEGSVKWYDPEKGYGFIVHPGGEEIFFHRTGIAPGETPDFPDGVRVTYCIEQTEKGPQAADVERLGGAE
jgi:CspA family cold shock protein